jgi:hypothetical protein
MPLKVDTEKYILFRIKKSNKFNCLTKGSILLPPWPSTAVIRVIITSIIVKKSIKVMKITMYFDVVALKAAEGNMTIAARKTTRI